MLKSATYKLTETVNFETLHVIYTEGLRFIGIHELALH